MQTYKMIQCIVLAALLAAGTAQDVATVDGTVDTWQTEQYKPVPTEFTDSTASAAYNDYIYSETTGYDYELPLSEDPVAVKPALLAAVPDQSSGELMYKPTTAEEPALQLHSTGMMWAMSAPAVLPEDSATAETDTVSDSEIKPTDKPGASGVSSSGGNPPGTIYYMAGGTAASSQTSSSTGTAASGAEAVGSSNIQVTAAAAAVSTPQVASSYEGGSVVNLVSSSTASVADDVANKSDVSSGFICGPASTYLLLLSLSFGIAYIL
jgi:hypothetical protein